MAVARAAGPNFCSVPAHRRCRSKPGAFRLRAPSDGHHQGCIRDFRGPLNVLPDWAVGRNCAFVPSRCCTNQALPWPMHDVAWRNASPRPRVQSPGLCWQLWCWAEPRSPFLRDFARVFVWQASPMPSPHPDSISRWLRPKPDCRTRLSAEDKEAILELFLKKKGTTCCVVRWWSGC